MTKTSYGLWLQPTLRREAERMAAAAGTTLDRFVSRAVAEKLSAMRADDYLRERAACADLGKAFALFERAGAEATRRGDEVEVAG
jgi:hypothetical protein